MLRKSEILTRRIAQILMVSIIVEIFIPSLINYSYAESVAPAAVGWGNLFVPGMGASLRGEPGRGVIEAAGTIGSYYAGTFLAEEAHFSMDGSVNVPNEPDISDPLWGQFFQEIGLKTHMYNTFYNYQQASMHPDQAEKQKQYQQPLYTGTAGDMLTAPFKFKNLNTAWSYVPILLSSGLLYYQYKTQGPVTSRQKANDFQDGLFAFTQGVGVPMGSAFGEEALWRGFMQREFHLYTGSLWAAIGLQALTFVPVHTPHLRVGAAAGGIYFGIMCHAMDGNLEPLIAVHFWVDFISAVFTYFTFRLAEGRSAPLHTQIQIPF